MVREFLDAIEAGDEDTFDNLLKISTVSELNIKGDNLVNYLLYRGEGTKPQEWKVKETLKKIYADIIAHPECIDDLSSNPINKIAGYFFCSIPEVIKKGLDPEIVKLLFRINKHISEQKNIKFTVKKISILRAIGYISDEDKSIQYLNSLIEEGILEEDSLESLFDNTLRLMLSEGKLKLLKAIFNADPRISLISYKIPGLSMIQYLCKLSKEGIVDICDENVGAFIKLYFENNSISLPQIRNIRDKRSIIKRNIKDLELIIELTNQKVREGKLTEFDGKTRIDSYKHFIALRNSYLTPAPGSEGPVIEAHIVTESPSVPIFYTLPGSSMTIHPVVPAAGAGSSAAPIKITYPITDIFKAIDDNTHPDALKRFIEKNSNVITMRKDGITPLSYAISSSKDYLAEVILKCIFGSKDICESFAHSVFEPEYIKEDDIAKAIGIIYKTVLKDNPEVLDYEIAYKVDEEIENLTLLQIIKKIADKNPLVVNTVLSAYDSSDLSTYSFETLKAQELLFKSIICCSITAEDSYSCVCAIDKLSVAARRKPNPRLSVG